MFLHMAWWWPLASSSFWRSNITAYGGKTSTLEAGAGLRTVAGSDAGIRGLEHCAGRGCRLGTDRKLAWHAESYRGKGGQFAIS